MKLLKTEENVCTIEKSFVQLESLLDSEDVEDFPSRAIVHANCSVLRIGEFKFLLHNKGVFFLSVGIVAAIIFRQLGLYLIKLFQTYQDCELIL